MLVVLTFVSLFIGSVSGCAPMAPRPPSRTTTTKMMTIPTMRPTDSPITIPTGAPEPTENPNMGTVHTSTFRMAVYPLVSWTIPSEDKYYTMGQQHTEEEAQKAIKSTISDAISKIDERLEVKVFVNEDVVIAVDIAEPLQIPLGKCQARSLNLNVVLEGSTIKKKCDPMSGMISDDYSPNDISGTFTTVSNNAAMVWNRLQGSLQLELEKMDVGFSEMMIIEPKM